MLTLAPGVALEWWAWYGTDELLVSGPQPGDAPPARRIVCARCGQVGGELERDRQSGEWQHAGVCPGEGGA
jgi:hypothetical protein